MAVQHEVIGDPPWLARARRELGVKEVKGSGHCARILQYHVATKLKAASDEVAWCSSFLAWVVEGEGIRSTRSAAAKSWATWGKPTHLQPGAVIVFGKSDPDAVGTGHVALCVGVEGDNVLVLGGNQNDAVTIAKRPKSRIVAVRWPEL